MAADSQGAGNITPASSTDHKKKGAYDLFKKRFKVALGCLVIRTQTELMIHRVQFIRRTKEAATQAACAGKPEDTIQNMGIHDSITEKTMMCIICFDHITTASIPLLNLLLMKRIR